MPAILFYSSIFCTIPYLRYAPPASTREWRHQRPIAATLTMVGFYLMLGVFQFLQYFYASLGSVSVWPGISVNAGSSVLFPLTLAVLLHVNVTRPWRNFLGTCFYLCGVNAFLAVIPFLARRGIIAVSLPQEWEGLFSTGATWKVLFGTALLMVDAALMRISYRVLENRNVAPVWLLTLPLVLALVVDAIGFSAVVAWTDDAEFMTTFVPQLATKLVAGLIYSFCLIRHFYVEHGVFQSRTIWARIGASLTHTRLWRKSQPMQESSEHGYTRRFPWFPWRREDPMAHTDINELLEQSIEAFQEVLPQLLKTDFGKWVGYIGSQQIGIAQTRSELLKICKKGREKDFNRMAVFVSRIEPDLPPMYADWE
jgi:hypothetical protein